MNLTTEGMRWLGVALSTSSVLFVIVSLGIRWHRIDHETRAKGIVFAYMVCVIDYGFWYGISHHLPLNAALYLMLPGLLAAAVVYIYYFIQHIRKGDL